MQLEHKFSVPASRDVVWKALLDPERVAPCMPGATITKVDGNQFSGTVKVKLGPVSLTYKGSGEFVETDAQASRVVIRASGKDNRGNGTAAATVTVTLTANGDSTDGTANTELSITGKPAQFGRGMISDVGGKILESFVACLSEKLGGSGDGASAQAGGTAKSTPVTSGKASRSAAANASTGPSTAAVTDSPLSSASGSAANSSGAQTSSSAPVKPASASVPKPREVRQATEAEPIDLFSYAGSSVTKRAVPVAVALLAVLIAIILWRRR